MLIKESETKNNTINAKVETKKEIISEKTTIFAASESFLAIRTTDSYLPIEITLIIAVIEDMIAKNPNSTGVNNLVSNGVNNTGIT